MKRVDSICEVLARPALVSQRARLVPRRPELAPSSHMNQRYDPTALQQGEVPAVKRGCAQREAKGSSHGESWPYVDWYSAFRQAPYAP